MALDTLRTAIRAAGANADSVVLYRGENENYPEVSSTLRRACNNWRRANPDFNRLQRALTEYAKNHDNPNARLPRRSEECSFLWSGGYDPTAMSEEEVELMGELQHWGAPTNLIEFTTNMDVAIFFASEEKWDRDGRVLLIRDAELATWRLEAKTPPHRANAQSSVFIRPPTGIVTPWQEVPVPAGAKLTLSRKACWTAESDHDTNNAQ